MSIGAFSEFERYLIKERQVEGIALSEDEIIRDWSLNQKNFAFVKKFKKQYHLWGYLQVCALKQLEQLLDNLNTLNSRIIIDA